MARFKKGTIEVKYRENNQECSKQIPAFILGNYAYHKNLTENKYTVTFIPSGMAVDKYSTYQKQARKIAIYLHFQYLDFDIRNLEESEIDELLELIHKMRQEN